MNTDGNAHAINEMLARIEEEDAMRDQEDAVEKLAVAEDKIEELKLDKLKLEEAIATIYEHVLTPEQKEKLAHDFLIDHGKGE